MAQVMLLNPGSGYLEPGETHHWLWYNAPEKRVWSFSVDVSIPKYITLFGSSTLKVEVTRVEYRFLWNGFDKPSKREIHYWIKNTGDLPANYFTNMAIIGG